MTVTNHLTLEIVRVVPPASLPAHRIMSTTFLRTLSGGDQNWQAGFTERLPFIEHYTHRCYHEGLQNLTRADVYFGRGQTILHQRERIKRKTIETRRSLHRKSAA